MKHALVPLLFLAATAGAARAYTFPERWNTGPTTSQNSLGDSRRVADFNGDGRPEIAELLPAGSHTVALNILNVAGERLYTGPPMFLASFEVSLVDVNQNGTPDYVIRGPMLQAGASDFAVYGFNAGFGLLDSLTTITTSTTTVDWFYAQLEPDQPLELVVVTHSNPGGIARVKLHSFGVPGFIADITPGGLTGSGAPFAEAHDLNANGLDELYVSFAGRMFMYASDQAVAGVAQSGARPAGLALAPPWPNPTSGDATLRFRLPAATKGVIRIHDAAGRRVRRMALPLLPAGEHEVRWDGRDESREAVAPGIYWMELEAAGTSETRRVVRLR